MACSGARCAGSAISRSSARLAYCVLFFLSMVLAWVLRDQAKPLIEKLPWIVRQATGEPPEAWFGEQAVYRVSLGNFCFFGLMSLVLVGVRTTADPRDRHIQHGSWAIKGFLWLLFNILPFFLPNAAIDAYGWVARVLSGIFLVIQMLLLLDFAYAWSDSWVNTEDNRWLVALLVCTLGCFAGAFTVIGFSFKWFHPASAGDCSLNVFLITLTLILGLAYSALALHPSVTHGSLLCSAVIFFYCSYLTFSAMSSEPQGYECNGRSSAQAAAGQAATATGMAVTLLSVVYSAVRTGSSDVLLGRDSAAQDAYKELSEGDGASAAGGSEGEDEEEEGAVRRRNRAVKPVSYSYTFFHLVFALASCYTAMLMTDWGSGTGTAKDQIGVGWTSVWVKMASQWLTIALYTWSLIAPAVFPDRDFS